jgi:transposase
MRTRARGSPSWPGRRLETDLLVCQRTQAVNALRGLLGEFGIAEPQAIRHVGRLRAHLDGDIVPDP